MALIDKQTSQNAETTDNPPKMKFGERLVEAGLITKKQLKDALKLQAQTGSQIGDILLFNENLRPLEYYQQLALQYNLRFVNFTTDEIDINTLSMGDREEYFTSLTIPFQKRAGHIVVATANPSPVNFDRIRQKWGPKTEIVITSKFDILWAVSKIFGKDYINDSVNGLLTQYREYSAKQTFTRIQGTLISVSLVMMVVYCYFFPFQGLFYINFGVNLYIFIALVFRLFLAVTGLFIKQNNIAPTRMATDDELPIYSIMVAIYKENETTLSNLVKNLDRLDYPKEKLDIKIVLEEDDIETIEIFKKLRIASYYEIIVVPPGGPKTKPKACNYALKFVRGEYVTVFDAEDDPDPNQLRYVYSVYKEADERGETDIACYQCRLNFYNSKENFFTKMFTLEYSYWYELIMPALDLYNMPIPLGGTSNHFKTKFLHEMLAWDPYNMTEDADLGLRISQLGYRTKMLPPHTLEEAPVEFINWIKQRTRWNKGHMQTLLVHNRHPFKLIKKIGLKNYLSFNFLIMGGIAMSLSYITYSIIMLLSYIFDTKLEHAVFTEFMRLFGEVNLIMGTVVVVIMIFIASLKAKLYDLSHYSFASPFYWLFIGMACYRALFQLIFQPFKWEKTQHGVSKKFAEEQKDPAK